MGDKSGKFLAQDFWIENHIFVTSNYLQMKIILLVLYVFLNVSLFGQTEGAGVTDNDNNFYKTVIIGTQEWMKSNLNVSHFRNGDVIAEAKTLKEWNDAYENQEAAWCYIENSSKNGHVYGRLYNFYAVNDPRGLAPLGFKIPSENDFIRLIEFLDDLNHEWNNNAGVKMMCDEQIETIIKERTVGGYREKEWVPCPNCSYWTERQKLNNPCTQCRNKGGEYEYGEYIPRKTETYEVEKVHGWVGTNESGFSGLPAGERRMKERYVAFDNYSSFYLQGNDTYFWTSDKDSKYPNCAISYHLSARDNLSGKLLPKTADERCGRSSKLKGYGLSVRCIKNQ